MSELTEREQQLLEKLEDLRSWVQRAGHLVGCEARYGSSPCTCQRQELLYGGDRHCRDCCCARIWNALEIQHNTGKALWDHVADLKAERDRVRKAFKVVVDGLDHLDEISISSTLLEDARRALEDTENERAD